LVAIDGPIHGDQHRYFLQVACQVWRHGYLHDGSHEGARRREPRYSTVHGTNTTGGGE
jgi:hypothetical protein